MNVNLTFGMKSGMPNGNPIGGSLVKVQNDMTQRGEELMHRVEDSVRWARTHDNKPEDHFSTKGQVLMGEVLPGFHGSLQAASPHDVSSGTPYVKLVSAPEVRPSAKSPLKGVQTFYMAEMGQGVSYKREGDKEVFQELTHNCGFFTVIRDNQNGTLTISDPLCNEFQ